MFYVKSLLQISDVYILSNYKLLTLITTSYNYVLNKYILFNTHITLISSRPKFTFTVAPP